MKQRKCKQGKLGFCYDYGNCDDCIFSQMIAKYENKIKKLKAENEKRLKANEDFATKHCCMKCDIAKTLVKEFAARLKKDPRINNYGLEFVALVDIDAELKALLKEYEK